MIEQIYKDFTTKLLPSIQEGLSITKEYFIDIYGRYIKYLIVSDIITLAISVLALIGGIVAIRRGYRLMNKNDETRYTRGDTEIEEILLMIFGVITIITGFVMTLTKINHIIKDTYIPEIRVIQQIQSYRANNN